MVAGGGGISAVFEGYGPCVVVISGVPTTGRPRRLLSALQALEQGALTGAGPASTSGRVGNDSLNAAAGAAGPSGAVPGAGGAGGGGAGGSRWVWAPLSAEELAAQAARDSGMVDVDDHLDVGELLRQADEYVLGWGRRRGGVTVLPTVAVRCRTWRT
jgi:hypothetical protein